MIALSNLHLFIINTSAGNKEFADKLVKDIEKLDFHDPYQIALTEDLEESTRLIRKIANETDGTLRVYACGGDGTLNGVINAAYGLENVAVGAIPTGTGNDFIKSYEQFSKNDFLNLEKMINGKTENTDLLFANGRICVNIATFGFDAAVSYEMNKKFRLLGGTAAYNASLAYCLVSQTKHKYKLFADDKEIVTKDDEYLLTVIANGKYYGSGFKASPYSSTSDGLIDLVWVPKISRITFLKLVSKYKNGLHVNNPEIPFVGWTRCKKVRVESDLPINTNLDGEITPMKNPEIVIKPNAIKIILPESE